MNEKPCNQLTDAERANLTPEERDTFIHARNSEYYIRWGTTEDVQRVKHLIWQYPKELGAFRPPEFHIKVGTPAFLVACGCGSDDDVRGFVLAYLRKRDMGMTINQIAVYPDNPGVAEALLRALPKRVMKATVVRENARALAFFRRMGFTQESPHPKNEKLVVLEQIDLL